MQPDMKNWLDKEGFDEVAYMYDFYSTQTVDEAADRQYIDHLTKMKVPLCGFTSTLEEATIVCGFYVSCGEANGLPNTTVFRSICWK